MQGHKLLRTYTPGTYATALNYSRVPTLRDYTQQHPVKHRDALCGDSAVPGCYQCVLEAWCVPDGTYCGSISDSTACLDAYNARTVGWKVKVPTSLIPRRLAQRAFSMPLFPRLCTPRRRRHYQPVHKGSLATRPRGERTMGQCPRGISRYVVYPDLFVPWAMMWFAPRSYKACTSRWRASCASGPTTTITRSTAKLGHVF